MQYWFSQKYHANSYCEFVGFFFKEEERDV